MGQFRTSVLFTAAQALKCQSTYFSQNYVMQTVNAESGSLYPWGPGNKQWPLNGTPLRAAWWRQQSILLHHNCNFHYIRIWFMKIVKSLLKA